MSSDKNCKNANDPPSYEEATSNQPDFTTSTHLSTSESKTENFHLLSNDDH